MGFQRVRHTSRIFLSLLLSAFVTACGGGGGGNAASPVAAAPPPDPAADMPVLVKVGPITGFGSVFVDGERFETHPEDTEVIKDDDDSDEDNLEIGMIVKVRSQSQNADGEWIAERIEFDEDVKGPIDEINGNVLVVLGQTVHVTSETIIDDGLLVGDLSVGEILEASGYRIANDEIEASYLERKDALNVDEYEVLGQIRELDTVNQQFKVGGLTVNYGLAELDDLDGGLANDLLVEVEDHNKAYLVASLILDATEVEGESRSEFKDEDDDDLDDDERDNDEDEFEIEAVITEIIDSTTFLMSELRVTHGAGTEFSGGTAEDLSVGLRVEVEGDLNGSDLFAEEIEFESNEARISGLVNAVDSATRQLTVMGILVQVNEGAELEDSLDGIEPFSLADLMVGDFVEIEGTESDNVVLAEELERDDSDDDSELRATLDAFDSVAETVTLFGELVITDAQTEYEIEDVRVSAADFFSRLHVDQSVVDADWDGSVADTLLPAKELSLED